MLQGDDAETSRGQLAQPRRGHIDAAHGEPSQARRKRLHQRRLFDQAAELYGASRRSYPRELGLDLRPGRCASKPRDQVGHGAGSPSLVVLVLFACEVIWVVALTYE